MPVAQRGELGESALNARLRPLVTAIDQKMSRLEHGTMPLTGSAMGEIFESWSALVDVLSLGPAPELRECPECGRSGMRAATRCGFCWAKLTPPDPIRDGGAILLTAPLVAEEGQRVATSTLGASRSDPKKAAQ